MSRWMFKDYSGFSSGIELGNSWMRNIGNWNRSCLIWEFLICEYLPCEACEWRGKKFFTVCVICEFLTCYSATCGFLTCDLWGEICFFFLYVWLVNLWLLNLWTCSVSTCLENLMTCESLICASLYLLVSVRFYYFTYDSLNLSC